MNGYGLVENTQKNNRYTYTTFVFTFQGSAVSSEQQFSFVPRQPVPAAPDQNRFPAVPDQNRFSASSTRFPGSFQTQFDSPDPVAAFPPAAGTSAGRNIFDQIPTVPAVTNFQQFR